MSKYYFKILGLVGGALVGYLYYDFIGCISGKCPITSSPYLSMLFGAVMGYLLCSIFEKKQKNSEK